MRRLLSSVLAASLLASAVPAFADDDAPAAPTELPCQGSEGRARARCITDAIKSWKTLEHDYDQAEDEVIAAWKAEHADMGIGPDYQTALRDFLNGMHAKRREFRAQLMQFRKEFFAEQKEALKAANAKAVEKKAEKTQAEATDLDAAAAICGKPTDKSEYRICMRVQFRKSRSDTTRRSRTNSSVIHQN